MATFSFKPALIGARCEIRVDEAGAELSRGATRRKVRFADVTAARLVEINMRTSSVSLVLMHAGGKFTFSYGGRVTEAATNANAAGFVAASVAVLEALAVVKPDLQVGMGGSSALRTVMTLLGIVMTVLGLLTALIPFGQGRMDGEAIVVVVMAVLIAAGGVGLVARYNPFSRLPLMPAAGLAQALRQYLPAN